MSRGLRWWMSAIGAVVLVLIAIGVGSWLVVRAYGPSFTRDRVERALVDALGRPARVERVDLQPWLARLSIRGLEVASAPTWDSGALLRVGQITVRVGISSLWRREIVLSRIALQDVDVRYTATDGGQAFAFPESIPDRVDLGPVTALISEITLAHTRIHYTDPRRGQTLDIDEAAASARPIGAGLEATISAKSVRASAAGVSETLRKVAAAGRLRGDDVVLDRAEAVWRGETIRIAGEARDLGSAATVAFDVRGKAPLAAAAELTGAGVAVTGVASFVGSVKGPLAEPTAQARVTVPELSVAGTTASRVSADIVWSDGTLRLSNVKGRALEGGVRGALAMTPSRPRDGRLTLQFEAVSLAAVEPLVKRSLGARGHFTGAGQLQGDLRRPLEADGTFELRSTDLTLPAPFDVLGAGTIDAKVGLARRALDVAYGDARWASLRVSDVAGRLREEGPAGLRAVVTADIGGLARLWGQDRVTGNATLMAELNGRWTDLSASGRAHSPNLGVADLALTAVEVPFQLSGRTLTVRSAAASLGQSRLEASGSVAWATAGPIDVGALREHLKIDATLFTRAARLEDLDRWMPPDWRGTGGFALTGRIEGTLATWRATGDVVGTALTVRGEPIETLEAKVIVSPGGVEVSDLSGSVRRISVRGDGAWTWDGGGRLRAEIGPAALARVPGVPDAATLTGSVRARADLTRRGGAWSGTVTAHGADLAVLGIRLGRGTAEATLADNAMSSTFAFTEARISGEASGRLDAVQDVSVRLAFVDLDLTPLMRRVRGDTEALGGDIQGTVSGAANLLVPLARPAAVRGTVTLDALRLIVAGDEWRNHAPVLIRREAATTRLERLDISSPLGRLHAAGTVDDAGRLDLSARGSFPLSVLPTLRPEIREAAGTLAVDARVTGTTTAPVVTGDGTLEAARVVARDFPEPLSEVRARFTATRDRLRVVDAVAALAGGRLRGSGEIGLTAPARLDLRITGRLPLAAAATLRPEIREAAGFADVNVTIAGTTAAPQAAGEGTIDGGRLTLRDYPDSLRDIRARFTVSPAGVRVASASASFAGGELAATGDLALEGRQIGSYRFDVRARRVGLAPVAGLQTSWDADLELVGFANRSLLRGDARLLRGTYTSELPLLRLLLQPQRSGGGGAGGAALPLELRVTLDDNLVVRTAVARFRAGGVVSVQGTTAAPIVFGTIETTEGQLIFRKQRFTITAASANFADPRRLDPFLDVQARARIQTYDVTLHMTGRSDDLQVRVASNPALPEEDVLSLIAFGTTREQLTKGGATAVAGEMAGLILQDFFGLESGSGMGPVDILELNTTETEGRNVRIGKRIGKRTTVLYSQGLENTDQRRLRLEYELVGPLVVAGEQDLRGGVGADILVRLRFR